MYTKNISKELYKFKVLLREYNKRKVTAHTSSTSLALKTSSSRMPKKLFHVSKSNCILKSQWIAPCVKIQHSYAAIMVFKIYMVYGVYVLNLASRICYVNITTQMFQSEYHYRHLIAFLQTEGPRSTHINVKHTVDMAHFIQQPLHELNSSAGIANCFVTRHRVWSVLQNDIHLLSIYCHRVIVKLR